MFSITSNCILTRQHGDSPHPHQVDAGARQDSREVESDDARQVGRQAQGVAPHLLPVAARPDGPGAVGDEGAYVVPGAQHQLADAEEDAPLEVRHPRHLLQDMAPVYPRHPDGQPAAGEVVLCTRYGEVPAGGGHGG